MQNIPGSISISSGQFANLNFSCFSGTKPVGTSFNGSIWVAYSTPGPGTTQVVQVATVKASVSNPSTQASSSGRIAYVPITITNPNAATGANFQQMISFAASSYTANEAATLGNLRFYQGTTELYSWCESGCTSSSASSVLWVNLPSGIGASSSIIINMTSLSTSSEYDGVYAGEAPQLTCSNPSNTMSGCTAGQYGEYDNGASVFSFYDNFAGTGLNPGKWTIAPGSDMVYSVANGIYYGTGCDIPGSMIGICILSNPRFSDPYIVDFLGKGQSSTVEGIFVNAQAIDSQANTIAWAQYGSSYGSQDQIEVIMTYLGTRSTSHYGSYAPSLDNNRHLFTMMMGQSNSIIAQENYTAKFSTSPPSNSISGYLGPLSTGLGAASGEFWQWVRVRSYPPSGAMPTTSFGLSYS